MRKYWSILVISLLTVPLAACGGKASTITPNFESSAPTPNILASPFPTYTPLVTVPTYTPTATLAPIAAKGAPIKVEIRDLGDAYLANPLRAKDQYVGKLIEVTGVITLLVESSGRLLVGIRDKYNLYAVISEMDNNENNRKAFVKLTRGENTTIVGVVDSFGSDTIRLRPTSISPSFISP